MSRQRYRKNPFVWCTIFVSSSKIQEKISPKATKPNKAEKLLKTSNSEPDDEKFSNYANYP
ncbi:hypothetical protein FQR65_LT14952 [Abscondita terminalis]|nr:hypothetical protein FQR65_LT14952 [Abscondita terminalis]